MISAWEGLAAAVQETGDWDDAQRSLSLDLRGLNPGAAGREHAARGQGRPGDHGRDGGPARSPGCRSILDELARRNRMNMPRTTPLRAWSPRTTPRETAPALRAMAQRDYDKALAELKRVKADARRPASNGYAKSTLRAWDVDALIARIQTIHNRPRPPDRESGGADFPSAPRRGSLAGPRRCGPGSGRDCRGRGCRVRWRDRDAERE